MTRSSPLPVEGAERLRRRAIQTLFLGAGLGSIPFFAAATASPIVLLHITGSAAWSGVAGSALAVGTGMGATLFAQLMARRGRRSGFNAGYTAATVGSGLAAAGAVAGSVLAFLGGLLMLGAGHSANQLARFAAAELAPEARRASAVSRVVWAATLGAVIGPNVLTPAGELASRWGTEPLAGTFMAGSVLFALAGLFYFVRLRPEPSTLAVADLVAPAETGRPVIHFVRIPRIQMALFVLALSQFIMILVMTVTPVHIHSTGHGLSAVGLVLSSHFIGMYGLAPVAGWFADRFGKVPSIWAGFGVLLVSVAATAAVQEGGGAILAGPLFLVGLGWSFVFVAASSLLVQGLAFADRARLQGGVDTVIWTCSGVASLLSGVLLGVFGYLSLSFVSAVLVVLGSLVLATRYRHTARLGG